MEFNLLGSFITQAIFKRLLFLGVRIVINLKNNQNIQYYGEIE